jgi:APA family basic amino acid/polyamine antiporter
MPHGGSGWRKPPGTSAMAKEGAAPTPPPRAELNAFDIGCVVIGGIVGVGIFFTPARVAAAVDTPGQVMLAWALGGVLAALGALVFAELATLVPGHGGIFRYIHAAFGPVPAFLYGWANWLVIQAGALGVVGLVLVDNLEVALGGAPFAPDTKVMLAAALMLAFTAINVVGLRTGKRVQNTLTVLKIAALAALIAMVFVAPVREPAPPRAPRGDSVPAMLCAAILPVLFAIGGWQQGSFLAGACRNPRRDMPLGILGGVGVVIVVYLAVNLAFLSLLGFDAASQSRAIGADAAIAAIGESGGRVLAAMIVVSAAGIMNTICLAPPYVLLAMAQAGLFPAAFGRLHPRLQTPVLGVLSQGLWAVALLLLVHFVFARESTIATLDFVCNGVVFVDWLFFALCGAALLRLRGSRADALRIPGGAAAAVAFATLAVAVTAGAIWRQMDASLTGLALVALGVPFALRRPTPR